MPRLGYSARAFSFPEALVTIALLVIFSGLLATAYFGARDTATRIENRNKELSERVSLATYLTRTCDEIQAPYWEVPENVFKEDSEGVTARYWRGDPQESVSWLIKNDRLVVQTPTGSWHWETLKRPKVQYWITEGRIVGIELEWMEGTTPRTIRCPWGARTL